MELKIEMDYNQILRLVHQLPKKEKEKLANTLQSEISSKKSSKDIQKLILNAPTWSDSDFKAYKEARIHLNKSRIA